MTLQYRVAQEGQVRDVDDGKRQVLVSIPWEVLDTYNTDFERSAFDEFLGQRMPVMCWQHQRSEPIGRAVSSSKSTAANEFVAQFSDFDAVPRARQAFAQIRDKEITDFSFGFDQAKSIPHPSVRGAIRFTHARMPELSPVTIGAIPGAVAVGIRAEAEVANIRGLIEAGAISEEAGDAMLREAGVEPPARERITASGVDLLADAIRASLAADGQRSLTISIGDDGTVTTDGGSAGTDTSDDDVDPSPEDLASATDAALDAGQAIIDGLDVTQLPDAVQQALALFNAAGVAVDELLEAMGVDDPDADGDAGGRAAAPAKGDTVHITGGKMSGKTGTVVKVMPNGVVLVDVGGETTMVAADDIGSGGRAAAAPYGDVAYADPGYQADGQKRYPIDTAAHVRSAWSYVNQAKNASKYSAADLAKVKLAIKAAAKRTGVDISADAGSRAAEDLEIDVAVALATMGRR